MVLSRVKDLVNSSLPTEQPDTVVAVDVGTEYVKAVVASFTDEDILVQGVGRKKQDLQAMHAGAIADIESVVGACEQALAKAEKMAGMGSMNCVMGLAGELVKGSTTTVHYKRADKDAEIKEQEIEEILDAVHERAQQKAEQEIRWELGDTEASVRLVNSAVVSIHIDGYKVNNPINFQGSKITIQLYTAFVPAIHIAALERVATELDLRLVAVAAEPFAVARAVIGNDPKRSVNAILIDVGGGTTDIAVVNDSGVEGTKMFSIGGRSFTKAIELAKEVSYEDAETEKLLDGKSRSNEATQAIDETLDVWINGVELALEEFVNVEALPNHLWLCGGGAGLPEVAKTLRDKEWSGEVLLGERNKVSLIDPGDVQQLQLAEGMTLDHTYITALGLLRVGHDSMMTSGAEHDESSIPNKLKQMLRI